MAQDILNVTDICRIATDPELRSLPSDTSVCQLRVAFNNSKKDQATGEWTDVGNFMNVTVWGKQGENVAKHLSKGSRIAISGRLEHRTWESDNGKREAHQIVAERVQYLDPKPQNGEGFTPRSTPASAPATAPAQ